MIDLKNVNRISDLIENIKKMEQYLMQVAESAKSRKIELYCRKNAAKHNSFSLQLLSNLRLSGQNSITNTQLLSYTDITWDVKYNPSSFTDEKLLKNIIQLENLFLKQYRMVLESFNIPKSTRSLLINQVKHTLVELSQLKKLLIAFND